MSVQGRVLAGAVGVLAAALVSITAGPAVGTGSGGAAAEDVLLPGPRLPQEAMPWRVHPLTTIESDGYPLYAQARYHNAPVFATRTQKWGRGLVRYGHAVRVRWLGKRTGCPNGMWYQVAGRGYVCSTRGFALVDHEPKPPQDAVAPDLQAPLPYRYARVVTDGTLRFERMLEAEEITALPEEWDDKHPPDDVVDRMVGDYFVALAEQEQAADGTEYYRTVRGHYVPAEHLKPLATPPMHGVRLGTTKLPVLFVAGVDQAPVFQLDDERQLQRVGVAEKHARAQVRRRIEVEGKAYWITKRGLALRVQHTRVARARKPPPGLEDDERWLHVDLAQQTLVAYEGATPVFATLISSGKEGHDTSPGEFRVQHKYVSITMKGDDPVDGYYEVEEVPWTQYYDANFAIHGAYWHNDFGNVRSHGCTNVAPADARFLHDFTAPDVPSGWHGVREEGTRVLISG